MTVEPAAVSFHGNVAVVRLARPSDPTNALDVDLIRGLEEAVASASRNPEVKVIVLTGSGRAFSSGAALADLQRGDGGGMVNLLRAGQSLLRRILNLDRITVAAINGLALGGGLELALACDIRWAHSRAVLGLPESRLGLIPGWGGISLLRRTAPDSLVAEMLAGGETIGARRARDAGLVSRVFEGPDFDSAVLAAAARLAEPPGTALKAIKARLKLERGTVDLAAGDTSFLGLWNERAGSTRAVGDPVKAAAS